MDEIYVSLELEERTRKGPSLLAKNEDLVALQTTQGKPSTRVLVKGVAGSGKSTLLAKLAYSWSQQKSDSPLSKFDLVFILSLREVQRDCSLTDAIFEQILADDTNVPKRGLQMFIESHPSQLLILLDGFDEYRFKNILDIENIGKIISYKLLRDCHIILSTRPHEHVVKHQSHYTSVKLIGFSSQNVVLYMVKFFDDKRAMVVSLFERLGESDVLKSLAIIPVMLMLMCLLWEDEQKLPDTQSELYHEFAMYLWRKHCIRQKKAINIDDEDNKFREEFNKTILELGHVALDGLCPAGNVKQEKIVFSQRDFEKNLYDVGCETGLLTRERLRSKLNVCNAITFLHKSFQEFCAAKYWAMLFQTKPDHFEYTLFQIESWDALLRKFELMKFVCGLVDMVGAVSILQHAINLYSLTNGQISRLCVGFDSNQSGNKDWGILPILILFYESGITQNNFSSETSEVQPVHVVNWQKDVSIGESHHEKAVENDGFKRSRNKKYKRKLDKSKTKQKKSSGTKSSHVGKPSLTKSFQLLFAKDELNVFDSLPQAIPMFHYYIKSAFAMPSLTGIKSLTFRSIPLVTLDVLTDTLQYTTSLQDIQITFLLKHDDNFEPSVSSIDKLGKSLAALSEVCKVQIRGTASKKFIDMNVLLHRMSVSPSRNKYTDLSLNGGIFKMADIGCLVSNLDNLKSLHLEELTECTEDVALMFDVVRSNLEHVQLFEVDIAGAIEHIGPLMTPDLHTLTFWLTSLEEHHIHKLSEYLSEAPNLKVLDLSFNTVGVAMAPLAQQLQHCKTLSKLDVSDTSIRDEGVVELAQKFSSMPELVFLNISGNDLGNASLDAVFKNIHNLPKLETLVIDANVDEQCSALVKDCLSVIGKEIPDKAMNIRINDPSQFRLIHSAISKHCNRCVLGVLLRFLYF